MVLRYFIAIYLISQGRKITIRKDKKLNTYFVSNSNEDITNPALKFYEAVSKLAKWYNTDPHPVKLTEGLKIFLQHYEQQTYPGLGTVKKLSIMHHLELMGKYLSEVQ